MLSREEALIKIFNRHGDDAVYITPTGFVSRAVSNLFPDKKNIFYMQGSMGLSPGIALGIALYTDKEVVAINGDGGHLMHLGITHTIRDEKLNNLFVYVLDNGVHESVGSQKCPALEDSYVGVNEIIKISCDGKTERVSIGFHENATNIRKVLK
jgi:thiamine pyrophosphate-dependent acetolactate synthase large subunit-like protein